VATPLGSLVSMKGPVAVDATAPLDDNKVREKNS
jgi:hypothetical protein